MSCFAHPEEGGIDVVTFVKKFIGDLFYRVKRKIIFQLAQQHFCYCMHMGLNIRMYVYGYVYMYVNKYVYVWAYVCINEYINIYI